MCCIKQEMSYIYLDFKSTAENNFLAFFVLRWGRFSSFWRELEKLHWQTQSNNTGIQGPQLVWNMYSQMRTVGSQSRRTLWYMKCLALM